MKTKNIIIFAFVLALVFAFVSCDNGKLPAGDLTDTNTNVTEDSDSEAVTDIVDTYIVHIDPPPMQEYYACTHWSFVVAEFGEPILPVDLSDGTTPILFKGGIAGVGYAECFAYPIKILRKFEATAYSPGGDYFPFMLQEWEAQGDYRPQSCFNYSIDYRNKDEIMGQYDDIIMIDSDTNVAIGEQYCLSVYRMDTKYPDDASEEYRVAWAPMYDLGSMKPILISLKGDKICLPEGYYEKRTDNKKGYATYLASVMENTNEKLTQLGLTDNLFRDGMTIDELDEYFNLVTNKETFAPLFEDVKG